MTKNMLNKVVGANVKLFTRGCYTYRIDLNTGEVYRWLTSNIGINDNGADGNWKGEK